MAGTKSLRIETLTLTDFRAFPGPTPTRCELDGKNFLVHGENGSGKSSVFHALPELFSVKPARSLRGYKNVFSGAPETSRAVEADFTDSLKAARWELVAASTHPGAASGAVAGPHHRSRKPCRSTGGGDTRVVQVALRRACLDYRSLLDTNYKHGYGAINLIDIAVNHLLADFPVPGPGGRHQSDRWRSVASGGNCQAS